MSRPLLSGDLAETSGCGDNLADDIAHWLKVAVLGDRLVPAAEVEMQHRVELHTHFHAWWRIPDDPDLYLCDLCAVLNQHDPEPWSADEDAPADDGMHKALGAQHLDGLLYGADRHAVALGKGALAGDRPARPEFTGLDLGAEDGRELPVYRLGALVVDLVHVIKYLTLANTDHSALAIASHG
jgi:hypothetical protein